MVDERTGEPEQLADQPVDPAAASCADPRLEQLARMIGELDLEGLFRYLVTQRYDLASLMSSVDGSIDGLGDSLDLLAETYPEHFAGWYSWCGDGEIQVALLTRPRIAAVVASRPS